MAVESGPKAQALTTALAALKEAADKAMTRPTLARIVKYCADNGVDVSDAKVSDWLTGKAVADSPQEFGLVVGCLNKYAQHGDPSYEQLDLPHWERLRHAAREERRGTQGARTPKGGKIEADPRARLLTSLHAIQLRESIAPIDRLRDRERELEMLTEFCQGDDQPYLWIQGNPWAGKSAVLSTFALDPPPNLTVVSFFVTDRLAARNDHTAFTAAVLDQLAVLMPDQKPRIQAEVINRDGLRSELLAIAARKEAGKQRRLVLVVDGLDEDTGKPSIASLLPALPDENLRIVVASRHIRLPIPHGHPLSDARRYQLAESAFAAVIRDHAVAELDALLDGPDRERELLALITVANGLSVIELESLTGTAPFEIDRLLRRRAGRSFRASAMSDEADGGADPMYVLAHETLQRTAEARLGTRLLTASLERLHAWAEQYRDQGWSSATPNFLLHRYFTVLERHNDLPRMAALALEPARHELLYFRTGGDWAALTEIRVVQRRICDQPEPDLLTTARLARRRDYLHCRNNYIPVSLVAARAALGQTGRAEALAHSIVEPWRRAKALALVAAVMVSIDPDRAGRLADRSEVIARDFTDLWQPAGALALLAEAIASVDPDRAGRLADRAEAIAHNITDLWHQAGVLGCVACAIASIDPDRAEAIVHDLSSPEHRANVLVRVARAIAPIDPDRAETIAHNITELVQRANALVQVAGVIAPIDPDRAGRLADRAEAIAHNITDPERLADALAQIAGVIAPTDLDRAETIANNITSPVQRAHALVQVAGVVAPIDPNRAGRIADRAETIANNITDPERLADALAQVAGVIAPIDPDRAGRLADRAEAIARDVTNRNHQFGALVQVAGVVAPIDPTSAVRIADRAEAIAHKLGRLEWQAEALVEVAGVIAPIDPDRAGRLADRAEAIAHKLTSAWQQAGVLVQVAGVIAPIDPDRAGQLADRAEAIARNYTDTWEQAQVLVEVAAAIAPIDPDRAGQLADRAEAIARNLTDTWEQAHLLVQVVGVMAPTDPDRAEAIARDITRPWQRADALMRVARVVAPIDLDRAGQLAKHAEAIARNITDLWQQSDVLVQGAGVVAQIDPHRAEAIARDITDRKQRADALIRIAEAVASIDPDRARSIIALAWETAPRWEIPIAALPVVAASILSDLASDLWGPL